MELLSVNYSCEVTGKLICEERKKQNWSQEKLGGKIGVSGKQISNYENGKLVPPVDVLFRLCELFECELGYLLGEEEYREGSKIRTKITNITGLSSASIDIINRITGAGRESPKFGYESKQYRKIINQFICSPKFQHFIECLYNLDDFYVREDAIFLDLKNKIGRERLDKALQKHRGLINWQDSHSDDYTLVYDALEQKNKLDYDIRVSRYELRDAFDSLIEDIYPRKGD
jgi:transcriptional regulator with XRE-family HTH domain